VRCKPNLFIIGASKCGTTMLHDLLAQHPDIFMSRPKELWHFNRTDYREREDAYLAFFQEGAGFAIRGESTPIYSETLAFPHVPEAIHRFSPHAKIIYMVREPFTRFRSQWAQTLDNGHWARQTHYGSTMPTAFREAVFKHPPFLLSSMYWTNIRRFKEYFEDGNIRVILFEEFVSDMERTCAEVFKFLGVDPAFRIDRGMARQNKSEGKSIYNPAVTWFRRAVPAGIRARLPVGLRRRVRDRIAGLAGPTFDHSELSPEEVIEIRRRLNPEVSALYEYRGIDEDPWAFFAESSDRTLR
jgi:hypothetical protein